MLAEFGMHDIRGVTETPVFNGGSEWARYWIEAIAALLIALTEANRQASRQPTVRLCAVHPPVSALLGEPA
jgi:hypothetical protein